MVGTTYRSRRRGASPLVFLMVFAALMSAFSVATSAPSGAATAQLLATPTSLDFGDVQVGTTSPTQTVKVTNVGSSAVTLSGSYRSSGPFKGTGNCNGTTLAKGASCQLTFSFQPATAGNATATITDTFNGVAIPVAVQGIGSAKFNITPTALDFGDVPVGSTAPQQTITITNLSSSPVVMSGTGGGAGVFGGSQNCQGRSLAPGASCQIFYAFRPTAKGAVTFTASGSWNGQSFTVKMKGNGTNQFLISPTALDFGEVPVNTTAPQQIVTITNRGTSPVVMSGTGGGAGLFGGVQNCQGLTLAGGASCHLYYAFHPTAAGAKATIASGTWNGQSYNIAMAGTGITGARTKQFLISPTGFDFGATPLGSPAPQQLVTITNVGATSVVMSGAGGAAGIFGGVQDCQGLTLAPGASCHMYYQLTPNALGALSGSTGGSWNGQPFAMKFTGNGRNRFLISPPGLEFGPTHIGAPKQQIVTITNLGAAVVMSGAGGAAGVFGGVQDCQGLTIAAGASCHMFYAFDPTVPGRVTGSTGGSWNAQPFALSFGGLALRDALVTPLGLAFGKQKVATTSAAQQAVIRNVSGHILSLTITGGAAPAGFAVSSTCPAALPTGAACAYSLRFKPTATGAITRTFSLSVNGQARSVSLTGTGT